MDIRGRPYLAKPTEFENLVCKTIFCRFDEARQDVEHKFRRHRSGGMNGGMFLEGRKNSKLDAIARMNALWIPSCSRIILVGSRLTCEAADSLNISVKYAI